MNILFRSNKFRIFFKTEVEVELLRLGPNLLTLWVGVFTILSEYGKIPE